MNISELSVKRPTLIVVIFTAITFLGIMAMQSLNYELLPKFTPPGFIIATPYPGASPSEVEANVSVKIEDAISSMANVDVINTISQESMSVVIVMMKSGTVMEPVLNEATRKIESVRAELPTSALAPGLKEFSFDDMPVMTVAVQSDLPAEKLFDELEYKIKPSIQKIDGVGEITFIGEAPREIAVNVDHKKLDKYKLSILQITQAIKESNFDFPAGKISEGDAQSLLRMSSKFKTAEEISKTVVSANPDGVIRLSDVAEVSDIQKEYKNLYRINGVQSLGVLIKKKTDANTVKVNEAIKNEFKLLEEKYKNENLKFLIPNDGSIIIKDAADSVSKDLINAIILVTILMILFLHSGRNAMIVMISVPLALIGTFIGIQLMGYTLNLMTLLALSLIIGTLVDDAIVVLENVYRHLEMGKKAWQATLDGVKEVNITVISTSLVLIVVFLPVALSQSIITPIIAPFAMVIVISVTISTFAALTVIPLLTSRFSRLEILDSKTVWGFVIKKFESGLHKFSDVILGILFKAIRHKAVTLISATVLFFGSFGLVAGGFIGNEFISLGDVGEGIISIEYPKNYTLKQNNLRTKQIEEYISKKPEVTNLYTSVGYSSGWLAVGGNQDKTEINIKLVNKNLRDISSAKFIKNLENELNSKFTDVKVRSSIVSLTGGADENPIQIIFRSADKEQLMAFANEMSEKIKKVPGTSNVKLSIEGIYPELAITFDKEKMATLGITPAMAGATIQNAFSGNTDSKFQVGDYKYDINIRLDEFNRRSIQDVENLGVVNNRGEIVKLGQFSQIKEQNSTSKLERYNRISSVKLEAQALGRSSGVIGEDIVKLLNETKLPTGVDYVLDGDLKYQSQAFGSLFLAILIAIVLVYLVMVALYESYLHPFVVLFSIPLSIIGALFALAMAQETINIFTMLGVIMLIGIVTKNAILVVDFINTLRSQGMNLVKASVVAVKLRIRPILMTALSTVIGMLPIAISSGAGSEWKNGLGWALIGGMTSSMLLSLVIVPVVYIIVESAKDLLMKKLKRA